MIRGTTLLIAHLGYPTEAFKAPMIYNPYFEQAGVDAAKVGTACADVDGAARAVIAAAGFGENFVHRVGHGIGCDARAAPYMDEANELPIAPGHAFSVEPGIYLTGRFGMRLEDIVVATDDGPHRLNDAARDLALVG